MVDSSSGGVGKKSNVLRIIIISLLILVGVFFLLLIVSLAVFILSQYSEKEEKVHKRYKMRKVKPGLNEVVVGMVSLGNQELSADQFISYQNENDEHTVISNFDIDQYKCTGICTCEMERSRRNSVGTITRTVTYLLAALSSAMAFQKARDYFQGDCAKVLEKECPSHAIRSEVSDCEELEKMVEEILEEGSEASSRSYFCEGYCANYDWETSTDDPIACGWFNTKEKVTVSSDIVVEKYFLENVLNGFCAATTNDNLQGYCVSDPRSIHCLPIAKV